MTLEQISNILNKSIVPNVLGEGATISPTLDNIVDLGTALNSMTADQFKTYLNEFAAGVAKTFFDTRDYNPTALPIRIDTQEYGGVVQSVKTDFTESRDSVIYDLVDGTVYNDVNKYFGTNFNTKIYEKDMNRGYVISIPRTMYKKAFTSAADVRALTAFIEKRLERTMRNDESAMEHNLISALIKHGKRVDLVTAYNNVVDNIATGEGITGTDGANSVDLVTGQPVHVTSANCMYNTHFMKWALRTIKNVLESARFASKKYNDGTINAWLTDSVAIFNSLFVNSVDTIHGDLPKEIATTPFWNSNPTAVIPDRETALAVKYNTDTDWNVDELVASNNATIENVIGVVFDKYAVGYTTTPIPNRTSYNEHGDFYNIFVDKNVRYFIDTRNIAIVFTLN